MRTRTLLWLFVGLNAAFAVALFGFILRSGSKSTIIIATNAPLALNATNSAGTKVASFTGTNPVPANAPRLTAHTTNPPDLAGAVTMPTPLKLSSVGKQFGWEQVEAEDYLVYLANLRAVGCPETKIRNIIITDVNELITKRRVQVAVTNDQPWWHPDAYLSGMMPMFQEKIQELDELRQQLLTKLIGTNWTEFDRTPALAVNSVQLSGPVLGALPPERYNAVQEICAHSMARHQDAWAARFNDGQVNPVEMAKLRDQTRRDLAEVLAPPEIEEFLLRYSHNSSRLRQDLRGFDPTPDEFRKIFRATDPVDHQTQLEYGGEEALSQKQRETIARQRDLAIREALLPERYQKYLLTKDPLYRQAQYTAMAYGAPAKAVQPIYEMHKSIETKRQQILRDTTLSPEQRNAALLGVNQEQQTSLQKIIREAANQR